MTYPAWLIRGKNLAFESKQSFS